MIAVSLKTAKQTGLTIPLNVLVRAALAEVMLNRIKSTTCYPSAPQ